VTIDQKEQLRLQRGARTIGVEVGKKGIVGVFEDERGVEACAEPLCQRGLPGPDWTFNRDVAEVQGAR
jgi:hypothetical protein